MAEVQIAGIRKSFEEGRPVLQDITFSVADGEFVSLLGGSGCGKTTLLRIVAGLESPDEGTVSIDGDDVTDRAPRDRDIAMVFQSYALYPHLDVRANIAMGLKLRQTPKSKIDKQVQDAARMLGVSELLRRRPAALSGGQRQRVALARALVREPKVFLLDEPLSNLDAALRERTRGELKLLFRRVKGTVLYVTHDQVEAMTLSDRIVVMDRGLIQQAAHPDEIYRRPANSFVASFVGSPQMNLLPLAEARDRLGIVPPEAARGRDLTCGIRPEDVAVQEAEKGGMRRASVELVEPSGASTLLTLNLGVRVRAGVPGSWDPRRTESWAGFPPEKLHWFDGKTGLRLE